MKKITTLIPAYKVEYLGELFFSLQHQTYKNFKVLLSDDSPDGRVREHLQSEEMKPLLQGIEVEIIEGPRKGAYRNTQHLMKVWNGDTDLFHLLFDDDALYPKFYEYHASVHQTPNTAVSISKRWTSQFQGIPYTTLPVPREIEHNLTRALPIQSDMLFKSVVPLLSNWLGEFSNAVIRKDLASLALTRTINGIPFMGTEDLGTGDISFFLQASLTHQIFFIQEHLGIFRINPQQHTGQFHTHGLKEGFLSWFSIAVASMQLGKLTRQEAFSAIKVVEKTMHHFYPGDAEMQQFASLIAGYTELNDELIEKFCALWQAFLKKYNPDTGKIDDPKKNAADVLTFA